MKSVFLYCLMTAIGALLAIGLYSFVHKKDFIFEQITSTFSPIPTTAFSLERAPTKSLAATIDSINGNVWWESRIATEPARLNLTTLQQGESIIASEDGQITFSFEGKGTIQMSPKTKIDLIQTLPDNLVLQQNSGETFYSVISPLSIRSLRLLTTISEGDVLISVDTQTNIVTVEVKKGKVTVAYNDEDIVSQVKNLQNGNVFVFESDNRIGNLK